MTRQVSLTDEAYDRLKASREENESFSDVVIRLTEDDRRKALRKLAGSWKMSDEDAKRMLDDIYANRRAAKFRKVDL